MKDYNLFDLCEISEVRRDECKEKLDEQSLEISELDIQSIAQLNNEQRYAYDEILKAVAEKKGRGFFINGPGGTGKTLFYRALLANVRTNRHIALATATSGVAASILPNGRTAHSHFKIPISNDGKLSCNAGKQTDLAKLLRATSLIIWDDMLRDITEIDCLFGGKVVVMGCDFCQVLLVIPRGTREDCVTASLVRPVIWPQITKMRLKENMRARTDPLFSDNLLCVGNGVEPIDNFNQIEIPLNMILKLDIHCQPLQQLIVFIFPDLNEYSDNAIAMTSSAVLTPKNTCVDEINDTLMSKFPEDEHRYFSIDKTVNRSDQGLHVDFLHSLTPNGMPPHELVLKRNCPVMLLRNINPSKELHNGT